MVFFKNEKYILGSIYLPPNTNYSQIIKLKYIFEKLVSDFSKHKFIFCGDFNINLLCLNFKLNRDFTTLINECKLNQIVKIIHILRILSTAQKFP